MADDLVQIAAYWNVIEASLPRARLEWRGIKCFLFDEHIVTVNWLYSLAVGGVKLKVKESDVEEAFEIIQEPPPAPIAEEDVVGEDSDEPYCPQCRSWAVYHEMFARQLVFASWILLQFPLPFLSRKWKCLKCGYRWRPLQFLDNR